MNTFQKQKNGSTCETNGEIPLHGSIPNLDCELSVDELRIFRGVEGLSDSVNEDLCRYCLSKARAIEKRLHGYISEAMRYEATCERIYNNLPDYAKW